MSDDIGAHHGIIHRAGCLAPTTIEAMPLATILGRNPYIVTEADGKGGERFRCRLCGMIEGQRPDAEPAAPVAPATPNPGTAGYPTKAQVLAVRAELVADKAEAGARSIAKRLGCHESTVRRRLGRRK